MNPADVTLAVIAKEPVPGRVKTRLCPPCTPAEAAAIAQAALIDTLDAVRQTPAARRICVLDGQPGAWLPSGFEVVPQVQGGLDERLAEAFAAVDGPMFLVGMDTPQLTPDLIVEAVETLVTPGVDSVLGLTHDGGYWGIGLRSGSRDGHLIRGVPMSQDDTGARQLDALVAGGLAVQTALPVLTDVDHFAEAQAVAAAVQESRFARAVALVRQEVSA